jgi:hypothetical protein
MHRSDIELGHIQPELKLIGLRDISFILQCLCNAARVFVERYFCFPFMIR